MDKQTELLRNMTGEERLRQAFSLSELVRKLARTNIRSNSPKPLTEHEVERQLRKRIYGDF